MSESFDRLNKAVSICSGSIASDNRPISEQRREAADVNSDLLDTSNDSENGEKTDQMKDVLHGEHETQVSEGGEAELHDHFTKCKKNPGHEDFIPIKKFSLFDLPEVYRKKDVYKYIKAVSGLTVRVAVSMTSLNRPQFWLDTDVPFPFYHMRGSKKLRLGSGKVRHVTKYINGFNVHGDRHRLECSTCPCRACHGSSSPSKVWGEVVVRTATHVVFDETEALGTTCRLFYDRQDGKCFTMDGAGVGYMNVEEDYCNLICVTCDLPLVERLLRMLKHFKGLWEKVYKKYKSSRDVDRLTFIVSHPHGCVKQVSIGRWMERFQVGPGQSKSKYTYTTSTCPGSSGATINVLGYSCDSSWLYEHVHSGALASGQNYSGVGFDIQ